MTLRISGLSKHFNGPEGTKIVLDGLELEVKSGEIFSLVGANGAGKTTLLKIISTLILPSSGEVLVGGISAVREPLAVKGKIGLVTGADNSFYQMLSAEDNLIFFSKMYGVAGNISKERVQELFSGLGMNEFKKTSFSHLSAGIRQRLAIARAMLVAPEMLLIDEISRSLDEDSTAKISLYLKEKVSKSNTACLVVSHDKSWAQKYSDRAGILIDGKITTT